MQVGYQLCGHWVNTPARSPVRKRKILYVLRTEYGGDVHALFSAHVIRLASSRALDCLRFHP